MTLLQIITLGWLLVLLADAPVLAQTGPPLWQQTQAPANIERDQKVIRGIAVQVDVGQLLSTDNEHFSLIMPDDSTLKVTKSDEIRTPDRLSLARQDCR